MTTDDFDPTILGHTFTFFSVYGSTPRGRLYQCRGCGRCVLRPLIGNEVHGAEGPYETWDGTTACAVLRQSDRDDHAACIAAAEAKVADRRASCRILGSLERVVIGPDHDHGDCPTFTAFVHMVGTQGFQLTFDTDAQLRTFVRDFCATFDVADVELLAGRPCYALKNFAGSSYPIEGTESVETGKRILKTTWWRANVDSTTPKPLELETESVRSTIISLERRLDSEERKLDSLVDEYVDWETGQS